MAVTFLCLAVGGVLLGGAGSFAAQRKPLVVVAVLGALGLAFAALGVVRLVDAL